MSTSQTAPTSPNCNTRVVAPANAELTGSSPAQTNIVVVDLPANVETAEGNRASARMAKIQEMLECAAMSVLRRCELIAEYVRLVEEAAQFEPPSAGGRQPLDRHIRRAARELTHLGKSDAARRAKISRALPIAAISTEAKEAAVAAGLDRQCHLLAVADEATPAAQVEKVGEIARRINSKSSASPAAARARAKMEKEIAILTASLKERSDTIEQLKTQIRSLEFQLAKMSQASLAAPPTSEGAHRGDDFSDEDLDIPPGLDRRGGAMSGSEENFIGS